VIEKGAIGYLQKAVNR